MYITMHHPTNSGQSGFESEEAKYAVADILTSFQSAENSTPLNLSTSFAPTSTTDILTPTTLANLEQTFLDLQQSSAPTPHTVSLARESGFVPPVVDPVRPSSSAAAMVKQEYDYSMYEDESSQESLWMPSNTKRSRYDDSSPMAQSYGVDTGSSTPSRRRKRADQNLTPEEEMRRKIRRERNKVAAAKCRQRRVDLTNKLITESEGLEEEQSKLENDIQMLNQQKEQLEFLLEAHKPVCSAAISGSKTSAPVVSTASASSVKAEVVDITYPSVLKTATVGTSTTQSHVEAPSSSISIAQSSGSMSRPNSLPIPHPKISICTVTEATGVPITTPSGVFNFGLESMLDGHTGLTPITGTPSCASQMHRASTEGSSSPSENLSSPTTLMAL